jgi:hypothetical protein
MGNNKTFMEKFFLEKSKWWNNLTWMIIYNQNGSLSKMVTIFLIFHTTNNEQIFVC